MVFLLLNSVFMRFFGAAVSFAFWAQNRNQRIYKPNYRKQTFLNAAVYWRCSVIPQFLRDILPLSAAESCIEVFQMSFSE